MLGILLFAIIGSPILLAAEGARSSTGDFAASVPASHSLDSFGEVGTLEAAQRAFDAAVKAIVANGGGILFVPTDTHPAFQPQSVRQDQLSADSVTVVDLRGGKVRMALPSLAYRDPQNPAGYASVFLDREVNQDAGNIDGRNAMLRLSNHLVRGSASYFQNVSRSEALPDPDTIRVYVPTLRGLFPGGHLRVMMGQGGRGRSGEFESTQRVIARVENLGWDPVSGEPYVDLRQIDGMTSRRSGNEGDYEWGEVLRLYNKSGTSTLYISDTSHSDTEMPGTVTLTKNVFGQGDNFGIGLYYRYMGNTVSAVGDEHGHGFTVDTWHLLDSFEGSVEAWDPQSRVLTYTRNSRHANTLGTSRPLVNMNPDKWITRGRVVVEADHVEDGNIYRGGYVRGIDTGWTSDIVGRVLALDVPDEYVGVAERGFWSHALQRRSGPVRRWWLIRHFEKTPDGEERLYVERVRGPVFDRTSPTLINPANYRKPLEYIIAPAALVVDVSEGILQERKQAVKEESVMPGVNDRRRISLAASTVEGTSLDFAPGDSIEQAIGPDPAHITGYRVRHREAMPGAFRNASFHSINNGAYPIYAGLLISGAGDPVMHAPVHNKFVHGVRIDGTADYGLRIGAKTGKAAIQFDQPRDGTAQAIVWKYPRGKAIQLQADADGSALRLLGADLQVDGRSVRGVQGISQTEEPARNLRGIDVAVPQGQMFVEVEFATAEPDATYSLTIQPSWLTMAAVVEKRHDGFRVQFSTAAPDDAKMDWQLVR